MCSWCPADCLQTRTSNRKNGKPSPLTYLELFQVLLFAMFTFYCVTKTVCWIGIERRSVKYTNFQTLSNIFRLWKTLYHRPCNISGRISSNGTTLSAWGGGEKRENNTGAKQQATECILLMTEPWERKIPCKWHSNWMNRSVPHVRQRIWIFTGSCVLCPLHQGFIKHLEAS